MYQAEELMKSVNDALQAQAYDRRPASLYDPVKYVLAIGGKRIRPVLMMLGYQLFKDNPASIMSQALALETYHNFTLLHDDLMDRAEKRRGHPTVHVRWNANTAILSGDTMLLMAYEQMQHCDAGHLPQVMDLFTETALEIGEGQQYDMDFETRNDVAEEEYIEMIRLKTSVLLACALKMGAILADAPAADAELLYQFGESLGLAFQLQDDLLDVYGDEQTFGKAIGGDIVTNKKTYMLINALALANAGQRAELMRWLVAPDFDRQEKVQAVTAIYNELGIKQLCEKTIKKYFDEAQRLLKQVSVDGERKEPLRLYAEQMMYRKY